MSVAFFVGTVVHSSRAVLNLGILLPQSIHVLIIKIVLLLNKFHIHRFCNFNKNDNRYSNMQDNGFM